MSLQVQDSLLVIINRDAMTHLWSGGCVYTDHVFKLVRFDATNCVLQVTVTNPADDTTHVVALCYCSSKHARLVAACCHIVREYAEKLEENKSKGVIRVYGHVHDLG